MYAIIETGGKQYKVEVGQDISVEKIEAEVGASVTLDRVLIISDGETIEIGTPVVAGASVACKVLKQDRGPKIIAFKFKRRKGYRRKRGHRQPFTTLRVEKIKKGA